MGLTTRRTSKPAFESAFARAAVRLRYHRARRSFLASPALPDTVHMNDGARRLSFTFALVGLSACVACVDGRLTRARYLAFRAAFPLHGDLCGRLRSLFTLACASPAPTSHYTRHVLASYPARTDLFSGLVERLYDIVAAGGVISPAAEAMLERIAGELGLPAADYLRIRQERRERPTPHAILGLKRGSSAAITKKRYRELMRQHHPDRHAGRATSPEIDLLLQMKAAEISAAYRTLAGRAV